MGMFDWVFGTPQAPQPHQGPQVVPLVMAQTERLCARTVNGTVIIDLRKARPDELETGAVFANTVRPELSRLGTPIALRVWMIPGAALDAWHASAKFVEIVTAFTDVGCQGSPDVSVFAGPHGEVPAIVHLLGSMGHQIFEVAADAEPPVLEVRLGTGQIIAGINAPGT
jgi:hypothetical protein